MVSLTHCHHGRRYTEQCEACAATWREMAIKSLESQAKRLGFRIVPIEEPKDD